MVEGGFSWLCGEEVKVVDVLDCGEEVKGGGLGVEGGGCV